MDSSNALTSCRKYSPLTDEKSHPRSVTLIKDKSGFGFTLRHFIVYPPNSSNSTKTKQGTNDDTATAAAAQWQSEYKNKPMDTIFIREVKEGSPAHNAGLNKGDRIIAINNHPLSGKSYSDIIHLILKSGQTLRLLVVPKEDDILQLYFASSAYQPVHREHKQHKYLVPSTRSGAEQSNQIYRQSAYGTYPGRLHKKAKSSLKKDAAEIKGDKQAAEHKLPSDVHKEINSSSPPHIIDRLEEGHYDLQAAKCGFDGSCFSEDEGSFHHTKEIENSDLLELHSPKLKDSVSNLYYSLCTEDPSANFSFSSEENLNYPIYMSDFDDIVHCDNMAESRSVTDAMHLTSGTVVPGTVRCSFDCESSQYGLENHSCDKICDSSCMCISDHQTPAYWTNNRLPMAEDRYASFPGDSGVNSVSMMNRNPSERNSFASEFDFSDNPNIPSINLVAQRRHQFESGNLLAESMERMNLYRSELSRMSKPNHVHIVPSRAAAYETKTTPVNSSSVQHIDKLPDIKDPSTNHRKSAHEVHTISLDSNSALDQQNSNKTTGVTNCVSESDMVAVQSDFNPALAGVVHRRKTVPVSSDQDECHIVRRISYLRATAGERMNVESDLSEEDETSDASSPHKEYRIQKLKSFFGEKTPKVKQALVPVAVSDVNGSPNQENQESTEETKSVYGWIICKVVSLEGKRSSDRSWRHLWALLRNNILYMLKERREPSKGTLTGDEHVIDVKNSIAKAASDYVKRKHVLRLMLLNGTEYLVQTESHTSMLQWLKALQIFTRELSELPEWMRNTSVLEKAAAYEQQIQKGKSSGQHHNVRKLVFRHRSPSEHSPSVKTRRASQGDELALSKIGVLWRDRMVQGWKKVHGTNTHIPKGASFGVKLENAPPGVSNEHIPLLVELCVQIVETRGLDTVGIYRVPGNNASVSVLTDLVNQGIDDELLKDSRWNDVNIVSSLLKAFFRKLPEPLLTSHLYPKFIQASETEDSVKRLKAIKHVLYHLPVHYFATLRYLMYHLKKVVEHSTTNKMEARNLAIVFGPTLVRATDNNMVAMVTDMPQQCYLIETMISYAEWLFEDCGDILPIEVNSQDKRKTHPPSTMQSNALLSNISKIDDESIPHEMFSSICNAASRHLRHRQKKKDPASYSKKRSGIIADDTDILGNPNENSIPSNFLEEFASKSAEGENTSDGGFISCSDFISGSSMSKRRSISAGQPQENGSVHLEPEVPPPGSTANQAQAEEELIGHRYNKLNTLAQEKIKNFEQETKALLRRDVPRTRASVGTPQVEWEQIEKEWQKAKLELEQEDLLDYLADDPSYLSCLLNRGNDGSDQPSSLEFEISDAGRGKSSIPMSSSSSAVKEFSLSPNSRSTTFSAPMFSQSYTQSNRPEPKGAKSPALHHGEAGRTRAEKSDIPTSVSQPILTSAFSGRSGGTVSEEPSSPSLVASGCISIASSHSESSGEGRTQPPEPTATVDGNNSSAPS